MPLHIGDTVLEGDYCISYKKKNETVAVCAPSKDDAKQLFVWASQQVGLLPTPP